MILLDACQKWVGMVLHDVPPSILNRKSCKACNARIGGDISAAAAEFIKNFVEP